MMSDVSNARRISFTALALVVFWVLAYREYWIACDRWHERVRYSVTFEPGIFAPFISESLPDGDWRWLLITTLSLGLIPVLLLLLSGHNSPLKVRDKKTWTVVLSILCAMGFCYWLGGHDAEAVYLATPLSPPKNGGLLSIADFKAQHLAAKQAHVVSWFLLLPQSS